MAIRKRRWKNIVLYRNIPVVTLHVRYDVVYAFATEENSPENPFYLHS